jgi:hypothetical protein
MDSGFRRNDGRHVTRAPETVVPAKTGIHFDFRRKALARLFGTKDL